MRDCIAKFDKDMLMKSNKSDLVVLRNIMEDNYMRNAEWVQINDITRKLQFQIDTLKDGFDDSLNDFRIKI